MHISTLNLPSPIPTQRTNNHYDVEPLLLLFSVYYYYYYYKVLVISVVDTDVLCDRYSKPKLHYCQME